MYLYVQVCMSDQNYHFIVRIESDVAICVSVNDRLHTYFGARCSMISMATVAHKGVNTIITLSIRSTW